MGADLRNKGSMAWVLVIIALTALFYFVYYPKAKEVKSLNAKYKSMKSDLDGLYSFIGGEDNLKDNILNMRNDLSRLEKAFPHEKEVSNVIKYINDEAGRLKVNVRSLNPRDMRPYKDQAGGVISVSGYMCKCLPLALNIEARYQALGAFLEALEGKKEPVITVERVEINKDEGIKPMVRATLGLNIYLMGQ